MIFSLIAPSRGRVPELKRFLQSVQDTTDDKSRIEVLLAVDEDDQATQEAAKKYATEVFPELNITVHLREKSTFVNRDYYNWLAGKAKGQYIWVMADDLVLLAKGWDTNILNKLNAYLSDKKDRIVCAGIQDNTPKPCHNLPPFPCFPLVSKETFDLMGFILHSNIPTWGADYLVYKLYVGCGRYLVIDDQMYINHVSYHTKQVPEDATARGVGRTFNSLKMIPEHNVDRTLAVQVPGEIQKIINHIREKQS